MTRSKKTKLQSQYTLDFSLIGIVCPMKEYKLGWHLNQLGIFHLVKNADVEIEFSGNNTIRISNLVEETEYSTVHLLRNKLQHPNSLQLNYLIPELQQFDYLIKISNSLNDDWSAEILSELKNCEAVDYCVSIDLDKVKAKDNLIFLMMKKKLLKKTKIVATIGPASRNKEIMRELILNGANVFRINFSHGSHEDHKQTIEMARELNEELGTHVCLLQDLQGPKIRVGMVKDGGVPITPGQQLIITTEEMEGTSEKVSTVYQGITQDVKPGDAILIDDGNIELKTIKVEGNDVYTEVVHGELLKSRKGINLPNSNVSAPSMTEKDIEDLEFAFQFDLEWVALSFVRTADDIREIKERIKKAGVNTKVVAKVEKPEAIRNMDEIIDETDALMVARGDLGVEVPSEMVPIYQKRLVKKCNRLAKPVIIATQMLESMTENPRPTRAETSDVANAVLDGADAVMLSAESASGKFPIQAVQKMAQTIMAIEKDSRTIYSKFAEEDEFSSTRLNDLLIRSACRLADTTDARAIVGMTKSGYSGFRISMHRPQSQIYIFTNDKYILRQMNLVWGVTGFYYEKFENIDKTLEELEDILVKDELLGSGDIFINTASMPLHWEGHTNMVRINQVK